MLSGPQFKREMIRYLLLEKKYTEEDIARRKAMEDEDKVKYGLLIRDARLEKMEAGEWENDPVKWLLSVPENYTKLRPGDTVKLCQEGRRDAEGTVLENKADLLVLQVYGYYGARGALYRVEIEEKCFLDHFIYCLDHIQPESDGMRFLSLMTGETKPESDSPREVIPDAEITESLLSRLNEQQRRACEIAFRCPSLHCIQGPPGTGKTDVLAAIALGFVEAGYSVVVLAGTHQAVNNALAKISARRPETCTVKIGDPLRATELDSEAIYKMSFNDYKHELLSSVSECFYGDVIGITIHSAVWHLGARDFSFPHPLGSRPFVILVDEAGQMPLGHAACIGTFGARSVILIGDDKQMPPIFHEKMRDDPLSVSAFRYITTAHPEHKTRLSVTYRLNEPIARLVSRAFYETDGEALVASDFSKDRRLSLPLPEAPGTVRSVLASEEALLSVNPSTGEEWEDFNAEEADFVAELVRSAAQGGMNYKDIAVITPYRRQVRTIREKVLALNPQADEMLMDTVERLQGQDVDMIIISFSVSSPDYFEEVREFILNPNRLNVMLTRAKRKVIIVGSSVVLAALKERYGIVGSEFLASGV